MSCAFIEVQWFNETLPIVVKIIYSKSQELTSSLSSKKDVCKDLRQQFSLKKTKY